jgi:dCTP deaminase
MPLGLKAGMVICAINFEKLPYAALKPYNKRKDAKYQSQQGAVASRISEDSGQ